MGVPSVPPQPAETGSAGLSIIGDAPIRSFDTVVIQGKSNFTTASWTFTQEPVAPHLDLVSNPAGGTFSGTAPEVDAPTDVVVTAQARASGSTTAVARLSLRIYPRIQVAYRTDVVAGTAGRPIDLPEAPITSGIVGHANFQIVKDGNTVYDIALRCPGLSFDQSTGVLSGTPSARCNDGPLQILTTDSFDGRRALSNSFVLDIGYLSATASVERPIVHAGQRVAGALSSVSPDATWGLVASPATPTLVLTAAGNAPSTTFSGVAPDVASDTTYTIAATASSSAGLAAASASVVVRPKLAISGSLASMPIYEGPVVPDTSFGIAGPTASNAIGSVSYDLLQNGVQIRDLSSLCAGMQFRESDGAIIGRPVEPCTVEGLAYRVTDSADDTQAISSAFSLYFYAPVSFTGTPPIASQGRNYSVDLADLTSGGRPPYSYALKLGALPDGMHLVGSKIQATEVAGTTSTATIVVTDAAGRSASGDLLFAVSAATATANLTSPPMVHEAATIAGTLITSRDLPIWSLVQVSPATPVVSLTKTADAPNTTFSGTAPAVAQRTDFTFRATATSAESSSTTPDVIVTVLPPLAIAAPAARTGSMENAVIWPAPAVANAVGVLSYSLLHNAAPISDVGSLCPGVTFDAVTGKLSGTPTATCNQSGLAYKVIDADGTTATSADFAITVNSGLAVAGASVATGALGETYVRTAATVSGGLPPYVSVAATTTSGPSLTDLGIAASISGGDVMFTGTGTGRIPATSGIWWGRLVVVDSAGASSTSGNLSVTVNPALAISGTPPNGTAAAYSFTMTATGGSGGNAFGATNISGSLAGLGLSLDPASGTISGASPMPGTWQGTIKVTDAGGGTATTPPLTITVAINSNAYAWGYGDYGQLGDGAGATSSSPVNVAGGKTYKKLVAGSNHSCGLLNDGTVQCWGRNGYGQLGNGTNSTSKTPVPVSNLSGVTDIAAGVDYSCAVVSGGAGGRLWCWGNNGYGQFGNGTTNNSSTPVQASLTGVTAVSTGWGTPTTCAVASGQAFCFGYNNNGSLGNGTTKNSSTPVAVTGLTSGVTAIAAQGFTVCAIQSGAAKCWGDNQYGGVGNGTGGGSYTTPVQVSGLSSGVTAIATGNFNACAIQSGAAKCWGYNSSGQLGNGGTNNSWSPVQVSGMSSGVGAVTIGGSHACGIQSGAAKCWGNNGYGQLGNGTNTSSNTPVQASGLSAGFNGISGGLNHTLAW
ncbi:RCC1 domain-containing protein [Rhodopseudomonas sp. BR0G17]|uniref:RCC1-like domain-containing protein n=1 Tax=Rhodopseudomonas sp. BR0G17 TaxID=2269368 RepID=UPI0013E02984|nr:RCC1 domain-containing protein [Rhodopseudomonas sp. BR0G17]